MSTKNTKSTKVFNLHFVSFVSFVLFVDVDYVLKCYTNLPAKAIATMPPDKIVVAKLEFQQVSTAKPSQSTIYIGYDIVKKTI